MAPNQTPRSQRFVVRKISREQIGVEVGVGVAELRSRSKSQNVSIAHAQHAEWSAPDTAPSRPVGTLSRVRCWPLCVRTRETSSNTHTKQAIEEEKLSSQSRQQLSVNPTKATIAHTQHMVPRLRSRHDLRNDFIHSRTYACTCTHG